MTIYPKKGENVVKCSNCGSIMKPVEDEHEDDDDEYMVTAECDNCGAILKEKA